MGDMGDIFNAMREIGRERRATNRESTPAILTEHGVKFESKNGGAHLIVRHAGKTADLWPGTGKYQVRGAGKYRRGVFNLMRDLGIKDGDNGEK